MKRSEMVSVIEKELKFLSKVSSLFSNSISTMLANQILEQIEKAGMLPPEFHFDNERLEGHIMHCQWEPENESV